MSNVPTSLRFACEAVDATEQSVDLRASFDDEVTATAFANRNPVPNGFAAWRITDRTDGTVKNVLSDAFANRR